MRERERALQEEMMRDRLRQFETMRQERRTVCDNPIVKNTDAVNLSDLERYDFVALVWVFMKSISLFRKAHSCVHEDSIMKTRQPFFLTIEAIVFHKRMKHMRIQN